MKETNETNETKRNQCPPLRLHSSFVRMSHDADDADADDNDDEDEDDDDDENHDARFE